MLKLTRLSLRLYWCLLVGAIVCVSLLPAPNIPRNLLWAYFDRYWAHFLVYAAVTIFPLLSWQRKTALVLSLGTAALSAILEMLHGAVTDHAVSIEGIVVNLLGVAAGVLLGLNILTLRSRMVPGDTTFADGSQSDLP